MIPLAKANPHRWGSTFWLDLDLGSKGLSCTNAGHEKAVAIQSAFTFKP